MCTLDLSGALSSVIGGLLVLAGTFFTHILQNKKQSKLDKARRKLLKKTLSGAKKDGWMSIETLSRVIGADLDSTRALLIQIDARGSMKANEVWSLISRNPLPDEPEQ